MSRFHSIATGLALAAGLTLASTATAQTSATFVKDINTNPQSSAGSYPSPSRTFTSQNSKQWAMIGTKMFFRARHITAGTELFTSDGTVGGTKMVKDISAGLSSSYPGFFTVIGSKVYFAARTAAAGSELWVTDGTATGTKMVKDILAGTLGSSPRNLARVGTKVTFVANNGTNGSELWVSDGTAAGTTMLKDIRPGSRGSLIAYNKSTAIGHRVFFRANDGTNGYELWVTDGTAVGTVLVKNIRPLSASSYPSYFQTLGTTKVVFEANNGTNGTELWISDGTAANTSMVKDVYSGPTSGTNLYSATPLGAISGKVLFRGYTAAAGYEPWITDGTAAGTFLLKDVRGGTDSSFMYYSDHDGGKAYWSCSATKGSLEIWVTDGTSLGTKRFSAAAMSTRYPSYIAAIGGKVFFQGYNVTANTGYEICMTDGTTTKTLKDIRSGTSSGYASYCSKIGTGTVAFAADDGASGRELWISKGTTATTTMIDINKPSGPPPTQNDNVGSIENLFGKLIFSATDGTDKTKGQKGQELYISDGTAAGTNLLKDIWVGTSTTYASSSYPGYMCRLGNYVYFSANDGAKGREVWRTDGTPAGTVLFKDIRNGSSSSSPREFTRIGDKVYFRASDGINGYELWVLDGTPTGTKMVKDIQPGFRSSDPSYFARLGQTNKFVFSAYNSGTASTGYELWISDGTTTGTVPLKDIYGGANSSFPLYMKSWGNKVYFQARTAAAGYELWVTDGTAAGTTMVKDLSVGPSSGYARYIELQNNMLYFSAYSATAGYEMHESDGTSANTKLYWDLTTGIGSTSPSDMTAVGSRRIYFRGNYSTTTTSSGNEPIYLDVTTKTMKLYDINPIGSSSSYSYLGSNGHVYMAARRTNLFDYQLLKIQNGATAQPIGRAQNSSTMTASDPRIGKNMLLAGKTSVGNPLSVVCLGVPEGKPLGLGTFIPNSFAYFQWTNFFTLLAANSGTAWATVLPVPNDASIIGMTAVLQTYSLNAKTFPSNTEVTNGIHITIGK